MWDLPGPGLEPASPALAGGFLTTALPGKPQKGSFLFLFCFLGGKGEVGTGFICLFFVIIQARDNGDLDY